MSLTGVIILSGRAWLIPVGIGLTLLATGLIWAAVRSAGETRIRVGCALLKLAGIAVLAVCLLEPTWVGERARPGANFFAIIADNSQGMQIKDANESASRGEVLRRELTGDREWAVDLEQNFQLRRYLFDSRLQSIRDFTELQFDGRASSLGAALQTAVEHWRGQPIAGVLLFTDGNATDISSDLPPITGCPPIYPVVIGRDTGLQDVALKKVGVSQTAFEDAPVTVQAQVSASGFSGRTISTELTELATTSSDSDKNSPATSTRIAVTSNVVARSVQRAGSGEATLDFRFQVQPDKPGLHFYELAAHVREEADSSGGSSEATLVNNAQMIVVDRGQHPFRVLYVAGRPNWEYKFLNRAIQADPQVQMVSIIRAARREAKFDFKGRAGESSNPLYRGFDLKDEQAARYDQPVVIRLNTKDEFELRSGFPVAAEELFRYDAIILSDVEAEFFTHEQMVLMQRFVSERGGGLLMLGGAESFREGGYATTPLASLLPVYMDRPVDAHLPGLFRFALTREGWLQPWIRLRATEAEEAARLEAAPPFEVLNATRDVKPGATVLATVSDPAGQTFPALVVQRFGLGRSAALMVGDLWRWGMQDENMQLDLAKAWRQLVRWLVSDVPSRVTVAAEPATSTDPAAMRLTVKVRDEQFKPLDNASIRMKVQPVALQSPNHDRAATTSGTNFVELTGEASPTEPGTYEATFVARQTGAYLVQAVATQSDGKAVGTAAAGWASDPAAEEFRSLKPNRALLESLARRTGGEVVTMDRLQSLVRSLPDKRAPITDTLSYPIWQKPTVFLIALGCFVAEWGIRRWKGLP